MLRLHTEMHKIERVLMFVEQTGKAIIQLDDGSSCELHNQHHAPKQGDWLIEGKVMPSSKMVINEQINETACNPD
ncbi:hypothetical protein [Ferrimonas balearica]|uniref:hypothetical protein n=1 Tax=Ferrimonas balearica TaxID=44012 RepID=UPI001F3E1131|nr:hypothetical protein [Ferrimonas balearica]MBY6093841.1 hypothetical protein [Ferrimonas balearica]